VLRLIGAVLLLSSGGLLGMGACNQLGARVHCLQALDGALERMERELAFHLTPMPELLSRLAKSTPGPAGMLFGQCLAGFNRLEECGLAGLWREAVETAQLPLGREELDLLKGLGEVLGRYDGAGQQEAVGAVRTELLQYLRCAEEERTRLGRVYGTLGLTAGAFLVLLLV
jgi:stage III sporulation protein AB